MTEPWQWLIWVILLVVGLAMLSRSWFSFWRPRLKRPVDGPVAPGGSGG